MPATRLHKLGQGLLHLRCLGGGEMPLEPAVFLPNPDPQGRDQTCGWLDLVQQVMGQQRYSGFTLGARHANQLQFVGWLAPEISSESGQSLPTILHPQVR